MISLSYNFIGDITMIETLSMSSPAPNSDLTGAEGQSLSMSWGTVLQHAEHHCQDLQCESITLGCNSCLTERPFFPDWAVCISIIYQQ